MKSKNVKEKKKSVCSGASSVAVSDKQKNGTPVLMKEFFIATL
jgi:hypothetical protein